MIPAMLSAIGISLSEFADSMVVSHLLSSDAFAIVNLGAPVALMVSMIYTITISQQASQNYEQIASQQQSQEQNLQRK